MRTLILCFIVCLCGCEKKSTAPIQTHTSPEAEKDPMTIVVALEENVQWGHYQFIRDGQFFGLEIDLLNHIDEKSPFKIRYEKMPWKRAMAAAQNGTVDILISATASPVRDTTYDYSDEVYRIHQVLYYDAERYPEGFDFSNQREIGQYKTGAILGYNVDEIKFPITHDGYIHLHGMAEAVERGWIDFAIGYLELEEFNQHMPEKFDYLEIPDHPPLICHWLIAKDNPRKTEILDALNSGLKQLKDSGHYARLENNYRVAQ